MLFSRAISTVRSPFAFNCSILPKTVPQMEFAIIIDNNVFAWCRIRALLELSDVYVFIFLFELHTYPIQPSLFIHLTDAHLTILVDSVLKFDVWINTEAQIIFC